MVVRQREKGLTVQFVPISLRLFFTGLGRYHNVFALGSITRTHDKLTIYAQKSGLSTFTVL